MGYVHVMERLKDATLNREDEQARKKQVVFVLSGMGGVGKSETVLQFLTEHDQILRQR